MDAMRHLKNCSQLTDANETKIKQTPKKFKVKIVSNIIQRLFRTNAKPLKSRNPLFIASTHPECLNWRLMVKILKTYLTQSLLKAITTKSVHMYVVQ